MHVNDRKRVRFEILSSLDRLDNPSTRAQALNDLRGLIRDRVDDSDCVPTLRLMFQPRNKGLFKFLLPLILDITGKHPIDSILGASFNLILACLENQSLHAVCVDVWLQLGKHDELLGRKILLSYLARDTLNSVQSSGLGLILVRVSLNEEVSDREFCREIIGIYTAGKRVNLLNEILLSFALLLPRYPTDFDDATLRSAIEDCLMGVGIGSQRVGREFALTCCTLLIKIGQFKGSTEYASRIGTAMSKDNLRLFAVTRCNPRLREAMREVSAVWGPWIVKLPPVPDLQPHVRSPTRKEISNLVLADPLIRSPLSEPGRYDHSSLSSLGDCSTSTVREAPTRDTGENCSSLCSILESGTDAELLSYLRTMSPDTQPDEALEENSLGTLFRFLALILPEHVSDSEWAFPLLSWMQVCADDPRLSDLAHEEDVVVLAETLMLLASSSDSQIADKADKLLQYFFSEN